jgi:ABC-type hemin transport system ATPase subunit
VEQAKRLTIGVELVASPSMIFLDEPTSGLDGHAAGIVLRIMRNISASGRCIICTIHQPSIALLSCGLCRLHPCRARDATTVVYAAYAAYAVYAACAGGGDDADAVLLLLLVVVRYLLSLMV